MDTYKKPSKTTLILISLAVLAGLIVISFFVLKRDDSPKKEVEQQTPAESVPQITVTRSGINYPAGWTEAHKIAVSEKTSGVTSVATKQQPEARVIVREVSAERPADFDISKLPDEIEKALSEEIEGFTLIEKRTMKFGSNDAVKIAYTQVSAENQQIYHFEMYIVPTAKKTYYITYSSPETIADISSDIETINQSIANYIK